MGNTLYADDDEWASNYECLFCHVTQHRQHMKMISCPFTVNNFASFSCSGIMVALYAQRTI